MINYEKYRLSRIVTVQEIVSVDYVEDFLSIAPRHNHTEAWEMAVCLTGDASVLRETVYVPLSEGQIILIPPGMYHDIVINKTGTAVFAVSFTCSNSEHLRPLQDTIRNGGEALLRIVRRMIQEVESTFSVCGDNLRLYQFVPSSDSPLGAEQMICCYLEQLLISLLHSATMSKGQVVRSGQFREAIQGYLVDQITAYITDHLGEHLTVEDIAAHFHYSRARLSTIYKQYTGMGINEMITYRRIKQAKVLLVEQRSSVAQIAEALGFSSPQYFSRKFTEIVGVPPSKFVQSQI